MCDYSSFHCLCRKTSEYRRTVPIELVFFYCAFYLSLLVHSSIYSWSSTSLGFDIAFFHILNRAWLDYIRWKFSNEKRGEKKEQLGFCKLLLQKAPAVMLVWHCWFFVANVMTQYLLYFGLLVIPAPSSPPVSAMKNKHQHKDVTSLLNKELHVWNRKKNHCAWLALPPQSMLAACKLHDDLGVVLHLGLVHAVCWQVSLVIDVGGEIWGCIACPWVYGLSTHHLKILMWPVCWIWLRAASWAACHVEGSMGELTEYYLSESWWSL